MIVSRGAGRGCTAGEFRGSAEEPFGDAANTAVPGYPLLNRRSAALNMEAGSLDKLEVTRAIAEVFVNGVTTT